MATWQQEQTQRRGLRMWSGKRWLAVTAIVVAIAVGVVLLVLYTGGGSSGGGGY